MTTKRSKPDHRGRSLSPESRDTMLQGIVRLIHVWQVATNVPSYGRPHTEPQTDCGECDQRANALTGIYGDDDE